MKQVLTRHLIRLMLIVWIVFQFRDINKLNAVIGRRGFPFKIFRNPKYRKIFNFYFIRTLEQHIWVDCGFVVDLWQSVCGS